MDFEFSCLVFIEQLLPLDYKEQEENDLFTWKHFQRSPGVDLGGFGGVGQTP